MLHAFHDVFNSYIGKEWVDHGDETSEQSEFIRERDSTALNIGMRVRISGDILLLTRYAKGFTVFSSSLGCRGQISTFSPSSASRMRRYLRECVPDYINMVTLTYPCNHGYAVGSAKRDLCTLVKRIKRKYPFGEFDSIFWFLEFQQRGVVHFHLFTTMFIDKSWLAWNWYQVVGSDDERHRRAGTRIESFRAGRRGFQAYASKYAAKHEQKTPPEGIGWVGRFWGVFGCRTTVSATTIILGDLPEIVHNPLQKCITSVVEEQIGLGNCRVLSNNHLGMYAYIFSDRQAMSRIKLWLIKHEMFDTNLRRFKSLLDLEVDSDVDEV